LSRGVWRRYDLRTKRAIYASHDIADSGIVNRARSLVVVLRDPRDGQCRSEQVLRRGESDSPLAFPDVKLRVDELLPPA